MSIDFRQSFSIRPDTPRVKEIKSLNDFINEYPDEELIPNLIMLNQKYQYYRPICGDGNCFYRACIFFYFTSVDLRNYNKLFPQAPVKNCINLPFQFDDFDVEQILTYIWKQFLLPLANLDRFERQKELSIKLNSSLLLDAFLIAYFRSLNHQYITQHLNKFTAFAEDDSDKEFTSVLTYSRQSQGIQLYAMAQFLNMKITIMMVHKLNFQQIVYMEGGKDHNILFYRPGHYDIICTEEEFHKEGSNIKRNNSREDKRWTRPTAKKTQPNVVKINKIQDLSKISPIRNSKNGKSAKPLGSTQQFYKPIKIQNVKFNAPQPSPVKFSRKKSSPKPQPVFKPQNPEPIFKSKNVQQAIPNVNPLRTSVQAMILLAVLGLVIATIALK